MEYRKTQSAPLHYILYVTGALCLGLAWLVSDEPVAMYVVVGIGALMSVLGFTFQTLTVEDEGDALAVRYGPLPLFFKRISYTEITAIEPDRTNLVDGWGIHYVPGRGSTYNLWGFECVKITLGRRIIRLGTEDAEQLTAFVRSKIVVSG